MDSFIFLVDLAYISPPPEADTKTNGLSSRSYKTSSPIQLALLRSLSPRRPLARCLPSNANVKHRRGELTFSASCRSGKSRGCISPAAVMQKADGHRERVSRLIAARASVDPPRLKTPGNAVSA